MSNAIETAYPPFGISNSTGYRRLTERLTSRGRCSKDYTGPVAWAEGALLLFRKSMIDRIGAFDETFFMYFEETELCWRARKAGWDIWQLGTAAYLHEGGKSSELRDDKRQIMLQSARYYYEKVNGKLAGKIFEVQENAFTKTLPALRNTIRGLVSKRS